MVILTEAKLTDLLNRAYSAGAGSVWQWRRKHGPNDPPRLQDVPKLEAIRAEALEPLIEEARQA
jgi:hypothetical protein